MRGSKYRTEERTCRDCGNTFKASVLIGTRTGHSPFCSTCRSDRNEARIERTLKTYPEKWYRPNSDKYEIACYKPNGDRRYYKHEIHAIGRLEGWYGEVPEKPREGVERLAENAGISIVEARRVLNPNLDTQLDDVDAE